MITFNIDYLFYGLAAIMSLCAIVLVIFIQLVIRREQEIYNNIKLREDGQVKERESKELLIRYHTVFNSSLLDMIYYDSNGIMRDINETACQSFYITDRQEALQAKYRLSDNPLFCHFDILPGVEFISENPYQSLVTNIDNGRIQQVITNFVTNAIKYTHEGHIKLGYRIMSSDGLAAINGKTATTTQNGLYVYCEDTGSGIPEDKQSSVFERFVKLNDYIQGTGLGLSICKAIVEKFGGEIGLKSEPGQGSTFWFWIPVEIEKIETKH